MVPFAAVRCGTCCDNTSAIATLAGRGPTLAAAASPDPAAEPLNAAPRPGTGRVVGSQIVGVASNYRVHRVHRVHRARRVANAAAAAADFEPAAAFDR